MAEGITHPPIEVDRRHTALYARALQAMPGGVSSPVRAFHGVGGTPLFVDRAQGPWVWDTEHNRYFDFVGSWGPLVLGHSHPAVVQAVRTAACSGTSFGAPCETELELAEWVVAHSPVAERIRFVNSGTEATMSALRLARAVTARDQVVKFDGCYHGHADPFLVKAGSGLATFGESSSAGVPASTAHCTAILPLDDLSALHAWFSEHGSKTAAVIMESVPANYGLLPQTEEWLQTVRELTRTHGSLLIVDEVITGFRLQPGGFCERVNLQADLVTYGKVIGGGLPVGAYGGPAEIMKWIAPEGPVYQAGTLSGNPLSMAAGLATLRHLEQESGWEQLEELGAYWESLLHPAIQRECEQASPISLTCVGSIFWLCFHTTESPRSIEAIPSQSKDRYQRFFHELLRRKVMMAPSAYEVGFLNLSMKKIELEAAAQEVAAALEASR